MKTKISAESIKIKISEESTKKSIEIKSPKKDENTTDMIKIRSKNIRYC